MADYLQTARRAWAGNRRHGGAQAQQGTSTGEEEIGDKPRSIMSFSACRKFHKNELLRKTKQSADLQRAFYILLASAPTVVLSVSLDRFVAFRKIAFKFHSFCNPFTGGDELLPIDVSAGD